MMQFDYQFYYLLFTVKCLYLQLIFVTFAVSKVTKKNEWKNKTFALKHEIRPFSLHILTIDISTPSPTK
jgi:hypothetical protein